MARPLRSGRYTNFSDTTRYNFRRLHSSLDYHTPAERYFSGINESNAPIDKMIKWAA